MRMHTATTLPLTMKALSRNLIPSTSNTTFCPEKSAGPKTREMVDRLVPLQHTGKASCSPLGAKNRDGNPTNWEHHGQLSLKPPSPNPTISPPPSNRTTYCSSDVVIPPPSSFSTQSVRVPTIPAHLFFLRMKIPASYRTQG